MPLLAPAVRLATLMTLLYYDPAFLRHNTGNHPECANRILPVARHLNFVALDTHCLRPHWKPCRPAEVYCIHTPEYLESLHRFCEQGGGYIEKDTAVSKESYDVAMLGAGAASDAVRRVVAGEDRSAFCLSRPPGHHALPEMAMGFCLLNNVAIAARLAIDHLGIERLLIVDWDVHHGNGTQAIFWDEPRVGFFSIHRWPFYPGTGAADEVGGGPARGTTCNVPISFGTPRSEYLSRFTHEVEHFAARIRPQLVIVSAGFDSHRADPVGSLGLESEDFAPLTRVLLAIADQYAQGRIVSVLEGGYNPNALTECIEIHLEALLTHES